MDDPFVYDKDRGRYTAPEHDMVIRRAPCAAWALVVSGRTVKFSRSYDKVHGLALKMIARTEQPSR